jgi:hypothetical protein
MSKSMRHLFADATALLEDLHGLAVEGRAADVPAEMHRALCRDIRAGLKRLTRLIALADGSMDA